ncbi:hypothetical protein AR454_16675 [Bacillus mycoides]|nr:hypothetical protein [Bacillus mycoides]
MKSKEQQVKQEQEAKKLKESSQESNEPEYCGSPEAEITCDHVKQEWENEQKGPKPKYTINAETGQVFDEDGNEIIDETKLPENPTDEDIAQHHKELHNRPPGWTWEGTERGE